MDILRPVRAFDRFQQRHGPLALLFAVIKKFADDQGGSLAALVAYYGFFSLFPLLLVLVTVMFYVLHGDRSFQNSVENSVLAQLPILGPEIRQSVHSLQGHVFAIAFGVVSSLWAGLGVTNAAQQAFDRIWAVPFKQRPDFLHRRLRGLVLLVSLGGLFLVSTVISGIVSGSGLLHGGWAKAGGIVLSLVLNFGLFLAAFRFLTAAVIKTSCLWLGVAIASVFWEILQVGGGLYINHVYRHSTETYGVFGLVLAILVFLHLGSQLTLYAAEINVVVTRKLWPRSLFGPPSRPADEETLVALAKVEERHPNERVEVEFEPTEEPASEPSAAPAQNS